MRDEVAIWPNRAWAQFVLCCSEMKRRLARPNGEMTVKIEKLRTLEPVTFEELNRLHTSSLLTRLKLLRNLQESFEVSDWLPEERDAVEAAGLIAFKETAIWKAAFADVKRLLNDREHMPRGSKEKRQQAAFQKQNR